MSEPSSELRSRKKEKVPLPAPDLDPKPKLIRDEQTVVDYEGETNFGGLAVALLVLIFLNFSLSYLCTGTPLWGGHTKLTNPRFLQHLVHTRALTTPPVVFSEAQLALYDGSAAHAAFVQDQPYSILLALNGTVYDVSESPLTYGPGGPYHMFAGRDAMRAFVTGCFANKPDELTHDLRGVDPAYAREVVAGWTLFFDSSHKYWQVGIVQHPEIELDEDFNPPPTPCENGRGQRPGFRDEYILRKKKKMVIRDPFASST